MIMMRSASRDVEVSTSHRTGSKDFPDGSIIDRKIV